MDRLVGNVRSVNKRSIDTDNEGGREEGRCRGNVMRPGKNRNRQKERGRGRGREGEEYWLSHFEREIEMDADADGGRGGGDRRAASETQSGGEERLQYVVLHFAHQDVADQLISNPAETVELHFMAGVSPGQDSVGHFQQLEGSVLQQ